MNLISMRPFVHIVFIAGLFSLLLLGNHSSQAQTDVINNVRVAVKSGDSQGLTRYFDNVVELTTDSEDGSYSKKQAEYVLKSFFRKYPPHDFQYNHIGSSQGGAKYTIGTYTFPNGTFRVYMKLKKVNANFVIDTIEFTKE